MSKPLELIGSKLILFSNSRFCERLIVSETTSSVVIVVVPRIVVCPNAELVINRIKIIFIVVCFIIPKMIAANYLAFYLPFFMMIKVNIKMANKM